jgi:hypothetical protein
MDGVPEEYQDLKIPPEFVEMLHKANEWCTALGLPNYFLMTLSTEDNDWAFILKVHGVIDAALEKAIFEHCFSTHRLPTHGEDALKEICGRLNFQGAVSKISILKVYGLISSKSATWCETLAWLRNRYAHQVSNLDMSLEEVSGQTSDGAKKLESLAWIRLNDEIWPKNAGQWRYFISLAAMCQLWMLHLATRPRPTLLTASSSAAG